MDIPKIISKAFLTNRFLIIRTFKKHIETKNFSSVKLVKFYIFIIKEKLVDMLSACLDPIYLLRGSLEEFHVTHWVEGHLSRPHLWQNSSILGTVQVSNTSEHDKILKKTIQLLKTSRCLYRKCLYQFSIKVIWNKYSLHIKSYILGLGIDYVILPWWSIGRNIKYRPKFYLALHIITRILAVSLVLWLSCLTRLHLRKKTYLCGKVWWCQRLQVFIKCFLVKLVVVLFGDFFRITKLRG